MRNLKKILALVLALVMALSLMSVASADAAYKDSDEIDSKYAEAVDVLSGMKIFVGDEDGFRPGDAITRAEVATIIYRAVGAKESQVALYKDYNIFSDVPETAWYAGYVNYCANATYIVGNGDGTFAPDEDVTGYQVLAMILRAVGYDVNGEFTGEGWQIQVASTAKTLGITDTVSEGTLNGTASREVVAELLFRTLTKANLVNYTPALGYQPITWTDGSNVNLSYTQTLGAKYYGLTETTGYIVGNQYTGEKATIIAATQDGHQDVTTQTGAQQFWSWWTGKDYSTTTDQLIVAPFNTQTGRDLFGHKVTVWHDTNGTVYALYDEAVKTDIVYTATNGAYYSDSYGTISKTALSRNKYPVYSLVYNENTNTPSVVIGVDIEVALISKVDTTSISNPSVTLAGSTFGTISTKALTDGSTKTLGAEVIATKINPTNLVAGAATTPTYDLDPVTKTVVGTVVSIDTNTQEVTLADGTKIAQSRLYNVVKSGIAQQLPTKHESFRFTLDNKGNYLGAEIYHPTTFIYGTYADFAVGATNSGTNSYYLTGVSLDGQKVIGADITNALGTNATAGYNNLSVAKRIGTTIADGKYTGYAIDANGQLASDHSALADAGVTEKFGEWTFNAEDAANGYKALYSNTLFLTENTKFIVVSGTGSATLNVDIYNGISALLGAADDVTLVDVSAKEGATYYTTSDYIYNNVNATTAEVTTVILPASALKYHVTSGVYYFEKAETNEFDPITNATQYALYNGTEKGYYYIANGEESKLANGNFYSLTETDTKTADGSIVYKLTKVTNNGKTNLIGATYKPFGNTDNLDTALIGGVLYTVTNTEVVNLANSGLKLGSIAELNDAVSSGYNLTVAIVYNNNVVSTIYVTGATSAER